MRQKHNPCIEERDWELEHKRTGWLWLGAGIGASSKGREGGVWNHMLSWWIQGQGSKLWWPFTSISQHLPGDSMECPSKAGSQAHCQKSILIIFAWDSHCPTQPRQVACMLAQHERLVKRMQQGWIPRAQLLQSSIMTDCRSLVQLLNQREGNYNQF